jgi:hypothetical protein
MYIYIRTQSQILRIKYLRILCPFVFQLFSTRWVGAPLPTILPPLTSPVHEHTVVVLQQNSSHSACSSKLSCFWHLNSVFLRISTLSSCVLNIGSLSLSLSLSLCSAVSQLSIPPFLDSQCLYRSTVWSSVLYLNSLFYFAVSQLSVTVSPGIEPGYIVFPSHKKQCIYLVRRTAIWWNMRTFLAVRRVWLDDPSRVPSWPSVSSHVIR